MGAPHVSRNRTLLECSARGVQPALVRSQTWHGVIVVLGYVWLWHISTRPPPLAGDPLAWIPGWSLRYHSRIGDVLGPGTAAVSFALGGPIVAISACRGLGCSMPTGSARRLAQGQPPDLAPPAAFQ